jgi:uncharacterized protein (TIGR04255 family)
LLAQKTEISDNIIMRTLPNFPEYENPPIIEVVCGILFKPLEKLLVPHFGVLWEKFNPEYSRCEEQPLLMPIIEAFERSPQTIEISNIPPLPRIWFVHENDNGIIQIQRDRFLHNWRKVRPGDEYPRYRNVLQNFQKYLSGFEEFLKAVDLEEIVPLQYELTYIDLIPQGHELQGLKSRSLSLVRPPRLWAP